MSTHTPSNGYSLPSAWKCNDVAYYTRGYYYGPMPVQNFLEEFMPYQNLNKRRCRPNQQRLTKMASVASQDSELKMYTAYIEALKSWPPRDEECGIGLEYHDNDSSGDPNCGGLAVDVAVGDVSTKRLWHDQKHIAFAEQESHTVFQLDASSDPFVWNQEQDTPTSQMGHTEEEEEEEDQTVKDGVGAESTAGADSDLDIPQPLSSLVLPNYRESNSIPFGRRWTEFGFENPNEAGILCRGQLAYYAAAVMTVQYRTHFFQLVIFGTYARFLRWDRSCAIVSQRFDYSSKPELIFDFYRRFAQLTPAQRGHDPQIIRSVQKDANLAWECFRSFFPDGWHGRSCLPKKLDRTIESQPFRTLTAENGQKYVICAPVFYPDCYTSFGRSTRCSLAYPLQETSGKKTKMEPFFMKDCFSQNYPTTLKESEVYNRIKAKKAEKKITGESVPCGLCDMIFGGDVAGTETVGHQYWNQPWVFGHVREPPELIAHRIILEQVGASIRTFLNFKTLFNCAADAMEAHNWMLRELSILHRDISPGNILMTREGESRNGYLIDFDHALDLDRQDDSLSPGWVGTLQFISAALLRDPTLVQSAIDDRESCFYTIVYLCLLHAKHKYSDKPEHLYSTLRTIFESPDGVAKGDAFLGGTYSNFGWRRDLKKAIEEMKDIFRWRYDPFDSDEEDSDEEDNKLESREYIAIQREVRDASLGLLQDGGWFYKLLRKHAKRMGRQEGEFIVNRCYNWADIPALQNTSQFQDTWKRQGLDGHLPHGDDQQPPFKRRKTEHKLS
ncbi:hypothetical protein L218DRAFT_909361 [Marasmius fiardii PR-910]|nr:hypothetical protein L218DRAFT_909361 [Marasmius fiardii PR-910]